MRKYAIICVKYANWKKIFLRDIVSLANISSLKKTIGRPKIWQSLILDFQKYTFRSQGFFFEKIYINFNLNKLNSNDLEFSNSGEK